MPRLPRCDRRGGALHHVLVRGLERRAIFATERNRKDFVARLARLSRAAHLATAFQRRGGFAVSRHMRERMGTLVGWVVAPLLLISVPALAPAQPVLSSGELRILGLQFIVEPDDVTQTVPRNQETGIRLKFVDPADPGVPFASVLPVAFVQSLRVAGELSGPGICAGGAAPGDGCSASGVMTLSAAFSDQPSAVSALLPIPAERLLAPFFAALRLGARFIFASGVRRSTCSDAI